MNYPIVYLMLAAAPFVLFGSGRRQLIPFFFMCILFAISLAIKDNFLGICFLFLFAIKIYLLTLLYSNIQKETLKKFKVKKVKFWLRVLLVILFVGVISFISYFQYELKFVSNGLLSLSDRFYAFVVLISFLVIESARLAKKR